MGVLHPNHTVAARRAVLAAIRSQPFDVAELPSVAQTNAARWVLTRLRSDHAPLPSWAVRLSGARTYAQLARGHLPSDRRVRVDAGYPARCGDDQQQASSAGRNLQH